MSSLEATPRSSSGEVSASDDSFLLSDTYDEPVSRISPRVTSTRSYSDDLYKEEEEFSESSSVSSTSNIDKILTHRETENGNREYYVKFKNQSYRNLAWLPESELTISRGSNNTLRRYLKRHGKFPPQFPYFPAEYTQPEKVIGTETIDGIVYYIVKWKGLDYDNNTLEPYEDYLESFIVSYEKLNEKPNYKTPPHPNPSSWEKVTEAPRSKSGHVLRPYQLESLNFFSNHWYHKKNVILADEMGLGKTCQSVAFLNYLFTVQGVRGPFLVLAPLSTIPHWEREIADWTDMVYISFYGIKARREAIKRYELFYGDFVGNL